MRLKAQQMSHASDSSKWEICRDCMCYQVNQSFFSTYNGLQSAEESIVQDGRDRLDRKGEISWFLGRLRKFLR